MSALDRIAELRAAGRGGGRRGRRHRRARGGADRLPRPQGRAAAAAARRRRAAAASSAPRSARRPTRRARRSTALIEAREAAARRRASSTRASPATASTSRCPARRALPPGHLHLITQTRRDIEDVFLGLGFSVAEGPEVELDRLQLRRAQLRPRRTRRARAQRHLLPRRRARVLRTHTSPVQVRAMMAAPPPLYVIAPGRVYRPDNDATHTPQFHQVEGLAVDEGVTLADLKGTLLAFARAIFGARARGAAAARASSRSPSRASRSTCRASTATRGTLADGSRCPLCKGSGWLEILGAGMVDPNVFAYVARPRLRPRAA